MRFVRIGTTKAVFYLSAQMKCCCGIQNFRAVLLSTHILHVSGVVFVEGDVYRNLLNGHDFHRIQCIESRTLLMGINEFLPVLCTVMV